MYLYYQYHGKLQNEVEGQTEELQGFQIECVLEMRLVATTGSNLVAHALRLFPTCQGLNSTDAY
jgi:hypothetical protein